MCLAVLRNNLPLETFQLYHRHWHQPILPQILDHQLAALVMNM